MPLHLIKLCVGCEAVEDLVAARAGEEGSARTVRTRHAPTRATALLDGGSLYWVFRAGILCRQRLLDIRSVGLGAERRCELVLDARIVRVAPTPRRPFQGWRYLSDSEAPPDLAGDQTEDFGASGLAARLRALGAW